MRADEPQAPATECLERDDEAGPTGNDLEGDAK